jgi:hypothetical protein
VPVYAGGVSDALDAASARAGENPRATLDEFSWLGAAIDDDAAAGRFAAWGTSSVIDEFLRQPVVTTDLFQALHERAGIDALWPVGNAGLLHVYGYLLSRVMTPFGRKRDRWIAGDLARLCGLPPDEFLPWVRESTLLERVTAAATGVLDHNLRRTERFGELRSRIALTDQQGPAALAYAVETPTVGRRIITMFPVSDAAALLTQIDEDEPRLRWNAALPEQDLSAR